MNILLLASLTVVFLIGMPIGLVIVLTTLTLIYFTTNIPLIALPQQMFAGIDTTLLLAVYFFILAGHIMTVGTISKRLIRLINAFLGSTRGGLAISSIIGCVFFAAISGSSPATVIAIGGIMIPAMIKEGYGEKFSIGLLTTAGSLGILIPPSIPMIIWALVMSVSVTDQFLAGVVPGLFVGCGLILYALVKSRKRGWSGKTTWQLSEIKNAIKEGIWGVTLPIIVLGGIYTGVFTPTEASAVAVVFALAIELFIHKDLSIRDLPNILTESTVLGATLVFIIAGATTISWYLSFMQIPNMIAEFLGNVITHKWLFLLMINVFLLFLGCFIDLVSAMLILGPIFLPTLTKFNIDPIHFGIIMVINIEIGFLTPPFGLNLFVSSGITKRPLTEVIKSIGPYLILMYVFLLIFTYFPFFSTWLVKLFQ